MNKAACFVLDFLTVFAITGLSGWSTSNPLTIVAFVLIFYIYDKLYDSVLAYRSTNTDFIISGIVSGLFTLFTVSATYQILLSDLSNRFFQIVVLGLSIAGIFILYFFFMMWLLHVTEGINIDTVLYPVAYLPVLTFAFCMLAWLPYFLYEYPGVMTPDPVNQYAQIIGAYELSNHHSVVHTMMMKLCIDIGGIAFYTICQMIFMAFVAAYVVKTLQLLGVNTKICIVIMCFYALMPYNGIHAVTILKDIPFTGSVTIFAASMIRLLLDCSGKLDARKHLTCLVPYIISGILICLLRGNGWYAFLVSLPFIIFGFRERLRLAIPVHLAILVIVIFIKYPCMEIYDIPQPDFVESVSIPVQQIANTVAKSGNINSSQLESLSKFVDTTQMAANYNPTVSDGIKNLFRNTGNGYIETHKMEFIKLWVDIGLDNPYLYFEAYVNQTKGYWYPDVEAEVGLADGIFPNEFGLSWQPIISGSVVVKVREILFKLQDIFPIYGILWSVGFGLWMVIVIVALCLRNDKGENAIACILVLAIIATLAIATPVANDFRYAYAIMYGMPLYMMLPFVNSMRN